MIRCGSAFALLLPMLLHIIVKAESLDQEGTGDWLVQWESGSSSSYSITANSIRVLWCNWDNCKENEQSNMTSSSNTVYLASDGWMQVKDLHDYGSANGKIIIYLKKEGARLKLIWTRTEGYISRGQGTKRISVLTPGWCLDCKGNDQNNGSKTYFDFNEVECLKKCKGNSEAKGCEYSGTTCIVHIEEVSQGSGEPDVKCWALSSNCQDQRAITKKPPSTTSTTISTMATMASVEPISTAKAFDNTPTPQNGTSTSFVMTNNSATAIIGSPTIANSTPVTETMITNKPFNPLSTTDAVATTGDGRASDIETSEREPTTTAVKTTVSVQGEESTPTTTVSTIDVETSDREPTTTALNITVIEQGEESTPMTTVSTIDVETSDREPITTAVNTTVSEQEEESTPTTTVSTIDVETSDREPTTTAVNITVIEQGEESTPMTTVSTIDVETSDREPTTTAVNTTVSEQGEESTPTTTVSTIDVETNDKEPTTTAVNTTVSDQGEESTPMTTVSTIDVGTGGREPTTTAVNTTVSEQGEESTPMTTVSTIDVETSDREPTTTSVNTTVSEQGEESTPMTTVSTIDVETSDREPTTTIVNTTVSEQREESNPMTTVTTIDVETSDREPTTTSVNTTVSEQGEESTPMTTVSTIDVETSDREPTTTAVNTTVSKQGEESTPMTTVSTIDVETSDRQPTTTSVNTTVSEQGEESTPVTPRTSSPAGKTQALVTSKIEEITAVVTETLNELETTSSTGTRTTPSIGKASSTAGASTYPAIGIRSTRTTSANSDNMARKTASTVTFESSNFTAEPSAMKKVRFGPWSSWGECTVSCGNGSQTRYREAIVPLQKMEQVQPTSYQDIKICNNYCPVRGGWGEWGAWSQCTVSCGLGKRNRTRVCDNPPPSPDGESCKGVDEDLSECILVELCPIDGSWSTWSEWSLCDEPCGGRGRMHRHRTCDNPLPEFNGKHCEGDEVQHKRCTESKQQECIKVSINEQMVIANVDSSIKSKEDVEKALTKEFSELYKRSHASLRYGNNFRVEVHDITWFDHSYRKSLNEDDTK